MKPKLTMMVAAAMACAAVQLAAMPTEEETKQAEPVVKKLLAQERVALESGKKTRSEVAAAAMKLAGETDTDAAKLLLMKGAFVLYVRDGKLEKAVETMKALKATIPDIPPQSVTNIIETALLGVSKKEDGAPLYKLLDESKADIASIGASSMVVKERNSIASILKGMIKVPGGDLWLSETELTQGQWEAVMGNNPSLHKGVNLPVENISRDECDIFLEKLNQTKEVQASQFEFCLPGRAEWAGAARAGNPDLIPWIKPGVAGELLDMAWLKENSDGETHAVATKVPNAFGFYDMVGNVHEWVIGAPETRGTKRGYSFTNPLSYCRPGHFFYHERNKRFADTGLRLAAHVRPQPALMTSVATGKTEVTAPKGGLARLRQRRMEAERQAAESAQRQTAAEREQQLETLRQIQEQLRRKREERDAAQRRAGQAVNAAVQQQQATVDGYTWSYRVKYGAATIVSEKKGKYSCAVSPMPTGDVKIPVTLNGVKVTSIGDHAFLMCDGMTSVTIPSSVTNIGWSAFSGCRRLTSVTIPEGVKCIGKGAFSGCCGLTLVTIPASVMYIEDDAFSSSPELYNRETNGWSVRRGKGPTGNSLVSFAVDSDNPSYSSRNGLLCSKDGADLIVGVNGDINIPDGVKNISKYAFSDCRNLSSVTIPSSVTNIGFRAFYNCSALKFVTIPDNVTSIGATAFSGCSGLTSMTIPDSVTSIGASVFSGCSGLTSVTIPDSVTSIGSDAFAGTPFYGNQPDGMLVLGGGVLYAYKGECPSSVTIPSSVTSIGKRAFAACRGRLESVTIPSSVTNIDEHAFWHCSGIKSFSVASDNPSYSSRNRMLCTKGGATLIAGVIGVNGNVTIPEGVANIGSSAFNGYSGLKSVTIPNGVTNIGNWAFHGCRGLTSVAIPEGVTSIGADAFLDCRGLTSVTIPNSVTSIGVGAFCTCSALKSVTMCGERPNVPNSLLPNNIFGNCGKLKSIHVPANAKSWVGMKAWQGIPLVFDGEDAGRQAQAEHGAERQAAESAQRQAAAERKEQLRQLEQIQEELRRQREAKQAEK